ncbi:hypothetical protein HYX00_00425 [Candidatus Woesearchaeota archaeon]|nr:hypothetical protein [Candidatus Woesearchaeota archaeon]
MDYIIQGFWKTATKWYFFPLLYLSLAVILAIGNGGISELWNPIGLVGTTLYMIAFLIPGGIAIILRILGFSTTELVPFDRLPNAASIYLLLYALPIVSYIVIIYYAIKKNIQLKWLIIFLLLFLIVPFMGCVASRLM